MAGRIPPAVEGITIQRIRLLRHLSPTKAAIAATIAVVVAATGTALANHAAPNAVDALAHPGDSAGPDAADAYADPGDYAAPDVADSDAHPDLAHLDLADSDAHADPDPHADSAYARRLTGVGRPPLAPT